MNLRGPLSIRRSAEHAGRFDVFQDGVCLVDAAPDKLTALRWAQAEIDKRREAEHGTHQEAPR